MGVFNLYTAAEENAGTPMSGEEYQLALPAAQHKLEHINSLYGTHHGEPYLVILIAEAVKAQRLTQFLDSINDLREKVR